jgi:hypothetical protein
MSLRVQEFNRFEGAGLGLKGGIRKPDQPFCDVVCRTCRLESLRIAFAFLEYGRR